jgi:hypothetical protein
MPRRAVTMIEIVAMLVLLAAGGVGSTLAGRRYGWTGYAWGFLAGSVGLYIALLLPVLLGLAVQKAFEAILFGATRFPPCRRGYCKSSRWFFRDGDYRLEHSTHGDVYRCRCGDAYLKQGRQVMIVRDDGTLQPYKRWKPFRGWRPQIGASAANPNEQRGTELP